MKSGVVGMQLCDRFHHTNSNIMLSKPSGGVSYLFSY